MTPDEAIAELNDSLDESIPTLREDRRNATTLGIEALKRILDQRLIPHTVITWLLPGETEE